MYENVLIWSLDLFYLISFITCTRVSYLAYYYAYGMLAQHVYKNNRVGSQFLLHISNGMSG